MTALRLADIDEQQQRRERDASRRLLREAERHTQAIAEVADKLHRMTELYRQRIEGSRKDKK